MTKTIQYANKHWVKFKTYICLREKEAYAKISEDVIYFGAMFFEVQARIFVKLINLNCRMSLKMLLSICLAIVDKEL